MDTLLHQIDSLSNKIYSYTELRKIVYGFRNTAIDFQKYLPDTTSNKDYSRNILRLEPFECVLLYWPPGVESAVHWHKGFYGFVMVLDGACKNVVYSYAQGVLKEGETILGFPGGVLDEPDEVIHKICNASTEKPLVTLHFYQPPLTNPDGMQIFDPKTGTYAELSEKAKTASFNQDKEAYKVYRENDFTFKPNKGTSKSHQIVNMLPKPGSDVINNWLSEYYAEQAAKYDMFDFNHVSRRKYTEKINELIAAEIANHKVEKKLAMACGTGRRALQIREASGKEYAIFGLDLSAEMCAIAEERDITCLNQGCVDLPYNQDFEAVTFLYAFGHVSSKEERKLCFQAVYKSLKPGGIFFLDVFNIHNENEWGPDAIRNFDSHQLQDQGFERGDVFYKKTEGNALAFLHYFSEDELVNLAKSVGFEVEKTWYIGYVYRSGELLENANQGSIMLKCFKPYE